MTGFTKHLQRQSRAAIHSGGRSRPIVVELMPPGEVIGFRLKGTRQTYYLPIATCYRDALRAELARQKAERKAEAAKRRKEKRLG